MTAYSLGRVFRYVLTLSATLCLLSAFALGASSDERLSISDFEETEHGWYSETSYNITITDYRAESTDSRLCLEVSGDLDVGLFSVYSVFSEPLDLSDYCKLSYDIFVPAVRGMNEERCSTRMLFSCGDDAETEPVGYSFDIEVGKWNSIVVDIEDLQNRDRVTKLEIGIVCENGGSQRTSRSFYLDAVTAYESIDYAMLERFMFDTYTLDGGASKLPLDRSSITMIKASDSAMTLKPTVRIPPLFESADSLRLKLASPSTDMRLTVNWMSVDDRGGTVEKSSVVTVKKGDEAEYYYLPIGDFSTVSEPELVFEGEAGEIVLYSVCAVPAYREKQYGECGSITECLISEDLTTVSFKGAVQKNTAAAEQDATIAVFAWDDEHLPTYHQLSRLTPLASCDMNVVFDLSFSIDADFDSLIHSRFFAAVIHTDGSYTPVAPLFRVSNPEAAAKTSSEVVADVKGFADSDISLVGDSDTGITVLTIDIGDAFSTAEKGESYIYRDETYYLDTKYLEALSARIKALFDAGVQVLLRYDGRHTADYPAANLKNGVSVYGDDYIGAISAYSADKWCGDGSVAGVILGSQENAIDGTQAFGDAVRGTAHDLWTVYANTVSVNSGAKVYVSVSDMYDNELSTNSSERALIEYLPALIAETSPVGRFEWELCIDSSLRDGTAASLISVTDKELLTGLLSECGASDKHMIFVDSAYSEAVSRFSLLEQKYIMGYYSAYFDDSVDAYIADITDRDELAEMIAETVRYIDTDKASVKIENAFLSSGKDTVVNTVDGYDADALRERTVTVLEAASEAPFDAKGCFKYFAFDSLSSASGISAGYFADTPTIVSDGGSALRVRLDSSLYGSAETASWMGIAHRFEYTENMEFTKTLAVELKVAAVEPALRTEVPVKLVLVGASGRFEAAATVKAGEWTTIYADISSFGDIRSVELLQVLVGDSKVHSANLLVRSITGLSDKYNDESLAKIIAEARAKKLTAEERDDYSKYIFIGGAALLLLVTVMIFRLLSRRRRSDEDG